MSTKKFLKVKKPKKEQSESEDIGWTEDDIPLSQLKKKSSSKTKRHSKKLPRKNTLSKKRKKLHDKKTKKKSYEYYKGKKIFTKSDSESSDFEKYTYFDEGKTKRKIKVPSDICTEDLRKKIREIKMENICLMKEHERVSEVKLRERMKLREEIVRLKNSIVALELQNHMKELSSSTYNNSPYEIIKQLMNHQDSLETLVKDDSVENVEALKRNMESFQFTSSEFWKNFNEIEKTLSPLGPLWVGEIDHISPNCDEYFKPSDEIVERLSLQELVEKYPYDNFTWNEKHNTKMKVNRVIITTDSNKTANDNDCTVIDDNSDRIADNKDTLNCTKDITDYSNKDDHVISAVDEEKQRDYSTEYNLVVDMDISSEIDDKSISQDDEIEEYVNCDDEIPDKPSLEKTEDSEKHSNIDNEEDGICCECGNGTSWTSFILRHREAYNKSVTIPPCNTCNMKFLKSGHFDGRHRLKRPRALKYRPATFMCTECGERCTSKSGLAQHALKHREAQYACQLCDYKCRRKNYLKVHMKVHTGDARPQNNLQNSSYACSLCSYTTNKSSSLKSHFKAHTNRKQFSCVHCGYATSSKSYLKSHIKYHTSSKSFKCDQCPYQCVTLSRLNVHKKVHDNIKGYACTMCEYKTTSNYNLKIHFKKHKKD